MTSIGPTNEELAGVLEEMAALLTKVGETNPYRVQAYLHAASAVRSHDEPLTLLYGAGGRSALMGIPGVGVRIARHLEQYIERGRAGLHDRLQSAADPAALFASVPGIGDSLARRIVDELGLRTLGELERAVQDGRLGALDGVGPRRLEALRLQLNSILSRAARRRARRVRRDLVQLAAHRMGENEVAGRAQLATIIPLFPSTAA